MQGYVNTMTAGDAVPLQQPPGHAGAHAGDQQYPTFRIGYAPTYNPAADPWHEDGNFEGVSAEMAALLSDRQHLPPQGAQASQHTGPWPPATMPYDPWEDDLDQPPPGLHQQPVLHQMQSAQGQANNAVGPHQRGAGEFDPPTMDPWGVIARTYASQGPLLPPEQWSHNALGLGGRRQQRQGPSPTMSEASTCANEPDDPQCGEVLPGDGEDATPEDDLLHASAPLQSDDLPHEAGNSVEPQAGLTPDVEEEEEMVDVPDDLEWDSDSSDSEDEDTKQQSAPAGEQTPKRKAGHGSQRVTNKAKKSDVKKKWRELDWGKKPKWLSWRRALDYIFEGGETPSQGTPPTYTIATT